MCVYSIPGFIAPITNKSKVGFVMACAFVVRYNVASIRLWMNNGGCALTDPICWYRVPKLQAVLCVYFVLSYSATFRFQPDEIDVSSSFLNLVSIIFTVSL